MGRENKEHSQIGPLRAFLVRFSEKYFWCGSDTGSTERYDAKRKGNVCPEYDVFLCRCVKKQSVVVKCQRATIVTSQPKGGLIHKCTSGTDV